MTCSVTQNASQCMSYLPSHSGEGPGVGLTQSGASAAFLLALSFFFRFQMGFALLGLGAWMAWQWRLEKSPRQILAQLGWLLMGATTATALGIYADAWLYGKPAFTAYNYFTANILENKAANWGTSPWWFYFAQSLLTAVPPLSVLLLLLLGRGLWRERGSALVWCLVPFLLAHIAVAHKEMRFLYPMLLPMLVLAVQGLRGLWNADDADFQTRIATDRVTPSHPVSFRKLIRAVCWVAVVVNFVLLPVRCVLAAQESVPYFRFLYGYAAAQPQPVAVFSQEKNVYNLVGLETHFYRSPKVQTFVVQRFDSDTLGLSDIPNRLLLSPKLTLQNPLPGLRTERIYTYFPDWILRFNPNDWQSRSRIWSLHECR